MAFDKKTWVGRLGEGLNKYIIGALGLDGKQTITSSPDVITQEGDALSANNLNDLEERIYDEFNNVETDLIKMDEKSDKVKDVVIDDFAKLDDEGNLLDSGIGVENFINLRDSFIMSIESLTSYLSDMKTLITEIAYTSQDNNASNTLDSISNLIDTLENNSKLKFKIHKTLTNCSLSNTSSYVFSDGSYVSTVILVEDYHINNIKIVMGGVDITSTAWDSSTNTITIENVTNNVSITISASLIIHEITKTLTECTLSNPITSILDQASYTTDVLLSERHYLSNVIITMGGVDITSTAWDSSTNTITISSVTGDISITAVASQIPLPQGYTELTYVAANGQQWIDTGIQEGNANRAVYEIMVNELVYNKGSHILSGYMTYFPFLRKTSGGLPEIGVRNRGEENIASGTKSYNWSFDIKYTLEGYNDVKVNGETICVVNRGGSSDLTQNLILFNYVRSSANDYKFRGRMYSCKIYGSNDVLLRYFVPCKNSNNVVGLYDFVSETFYHSDTGIELIAGEEV